ncbi:type II restriction endonuclease subunit M [Streptomyces parvulus]|uniref:Eco57I restriction-modification methylase domain-containing protein n=1 Tax=Streptomyces parvulus TaxID=146923 RepID=UPI001E3E4D4C|nr:type II restriction endonuclease subunit M [Streptomyces parvulus]MCC9153357.1 type II restriction endonuclease subunit M [Streptomyces parvulus]MCE7686658.1 type II restriction endonuclease subunit M [Streptomyces parvulus]
MAFEAITNRGEYISAHYLAELFARDLTDLRKRWTSADRAGAPSSRSGVKNLRREYFKAKVRITENDAVDGPEVRDLNDRLLAALAYIAPKGEDAEETPEPEGSTHTRLHRGDFDVMQGDKERSVPVALAVTGPGGVELVALDVTWEVDGELVVADVEDGGARLLDPIQLDGKDRVTGAHEAVTFLFGCDDGYAPRYVLLLAGGVVLLADRTAWHEGRFLAVSVDEALDRNLSADGEELEAVAALFGAESLLTEGGVAGYLDNLIDKGRKHAVGVSKELREGLRQSVELIAQEILNRIKEGGADPAELGDPSDLASRLTRESLRYLYRLLFLLYAEARPELGILPSKDEAYQDGYGLARLGELVSYDLPEEAQDGTHFAESLDLLFRLVDQGHRPLGTEKKPSDDNVTVLDADGLRFEALRSDLFKADATPLIGTVSIDGQRIDTRLRNSVLWRVLNLLMLTQGRRSGRGKAGGGTGKGFISYAQLGINQLGAVYEGLMSYTGFFAWDDLYEVAKPDSDGLSGTWMVPFEDADDYEEKYFPKRPHELTGAPKRIEHKKGTFVYRLSGRERQRSASYYTPEILTRSTVKHALAELLDQDGKTTPARDILDLTVCEPALGSGAFLNEVINQLAMEYLRRRMAELGGEQLPPDRYEAELQKVKAYLALHNCYGVDLNQTAVELAEVSLWLNSMHEGLKAPWFGLHLRRGNSLIGARRAVYASEALKKKAWLTTVPTDRPLRAGAEEGQFRAGEEIHHFLLPAKGWGAVADAKQAKELVKDERDALAKWRTAVTATPSVAQGKRLLALATRVERLWELTKRRLIVSEREVRRQIDVWEVAPDKPLPKASGDVTREQIESALNEPGSPRGRLKLVMDAWCAMWFWPVGQPDTPMPPTLEEWLSFCEAVLGVPAAKAKARPSGKIGGGAAGLEDEFGLFADTGEFEKLAIDDEFDRVMSQCADLPSVTLRFPWLSEIDAISRSEGFFHWELEFSHIFECGGFDLQVGNPPWVNFEWSDDVSLAEYDARFGVKDKISERQREAWRSAVLENTEYKCRYLVDLTSWAGVNSHLGSDLNYPALSGIRTNLYMNFIERAWRNLGRRGIAALIHEENHLSAPAAGRMRAATYERLRRHFQFGNNILLFEDVDNNKNFGISVYGQPKEVGFSQISRVVHPMVVDASYSHNGEGDLPGIQFAEGGWDLRPHRERIVSVTREVLEDWAALIDPPGTPAVQARCLRPVTSDDNTALRALSSFPERMEGSTFWWTSGLNEKGAKEGLVMEWRTQIPSSWTDVILQGPHFSAATPFAKQPNPECKSNKDYSVWDLRHLTCSEIPRTNYVFTSHVGPSGRPTKIWGGQNSVSFYRLMWRRMITSNTERSLNAAMFPPGPSHVDAVHSLAFADARKTASVAGFWASLPFDYLVKVSGASKVNPELVQNFPAPFAHPLVVPLLLRILRLNCLTDNYAPLWGELFEPDWLSDRWTNPDSLCSPLQAVEATWSMETPLRTEYERRMALVELDALVALMLGLTAEQLCAMYRSQFAVLRKYEWEMFFAPDGHKIGAATHNVGIRQTPEETAFVKAWAKAARAGDPTPAVPEGWVKPNREAEMTRAHADFTARLHAGEYGDYAAYLAEHPLTTPTPAPEGK